MEEVDTLVIGAGVSGLAYANAARAQAPSAAVLVVEAEAEPGGYCRTVHQDGFVWDYSGHFFHFKHPEIEAWLRARMPGQDVRTVHKRSAIWLDDVTVDFPFQRNIHQLPQADFIECLHDVYVASKAPPGPAPSSFLAMLYQRLGRGIVERFLRPYNEKLYACDLDELDVDAMGRFFPQVSLDDILASLAPGRTRDEGYNATFTYPAGGAIEYVRALLHDLPAAAIALGERVEAIDLASRVARTDRRELRYRRVVSSAPLPALLALTGAAHDAAAFAWNRVLVFNLGFDRKGPPRTTGMHWLYFPARDLPFYRVGFYDNILGGDRMSLYVEIGAPRGRAFDVEVLRGEVMAGLARAGVVTDQQLVSWHHVVLDPAYVHITRGSLAEAARAREALAAHDVYSIGRYGGWTYCSIEDNIVEARALAARLAA
ncbi:MAG: NAD(P)-binding protein [Kofleriaceae bacterium]